MVCNQAETEKKKEERRRKARGNVRGEALEYIEGEEWLILLGALAAAAYMMFLSSTMFLYLSRNPGTVWSKIWWASLFTGISTTVLLVYPRLPGMIYHEILNLKRWREEQLLAKQGRMV